MAIRKEKQKETRKDIKVTVNNHILDIITPMAIEFRAKDFYYGENLSRVIVIRNYPSKVRIGWLSRIANMEGVTCSIHLTPTNSSKLTENISKSIGEIAGRINNGGSALMMQRAEQQYRDANTLLRKIDQEQENVFYVTIVIMISAGDTEELDRKSRKIESALAGSKMRGRVAMFKQEDALLAVSPYGICPQSIKDMASRNMPLSTIAGAYPFNSSGINDGTGWIFGKDNQGGIILLDTWMRGGDRTNSNWTLLGVPGVGKSATAKHIIANEYALGTKIIIIDPEREYRDLCNNLAGQWINCGGGAGGRINPLQVKEVPKDDEGEEKENSLFKDEGKGMGNLALHFQIDRTFFKLYLKNLDDMDQAILEESLEELYLKHGITWDTDTSQIPNEQYPIMEDLYKLMSEKLNLSDISDRKRDKYEKLSLLLRRAAIGADASLWNGHTTIEAKNDFIVLDTHDLQEADEQIKTTQYFNILTWAWNQLSKNREERVLLIVDEAYLLVDPEVPQALQFLRNVSKRIRKYEGGLGVISHSVVDFLDPAVRRHGQALLDNPCFKFFMGTDGKNLEELTKLMDLTDAEQDVLLKKRRGAGILIAGSKRVHAKVEIADFEFELFGKGGGN
jgi:type IV secretory pathway VirB4 component